MNDALGDRMKANYEDRTRFLLPRRTNTIIRLDGKAFHSWTKKVKLLRPFDERYHEIFTEAAKATFKELQGCKLGYFQSDELSFLLQDFESEQTQAYFDGNLQKICSVAASTMTAHFNLIWTYSNVSSLDNTVPAMFDARVFTIPDINEVANYFLWRHRDASKNSISMMAQEMFSHKELQGKSCVEMLDMIYAKSHSDNFRDPSIPFMPWDKLDSWKKNGTFIYKKERAIISIEDKMDFKDLLHLVTKVDEK